MPIRYATLDQSASHANGSVAPALPAARRSTRGLQARTALRGVAYSDRDGLPSLFGGLPYPKLSLRFNLAGGRSTRSRVTSCIGGRITGFSRTAACRHRPSPYTD